MINIRIKQAREHLGYSQEYVADKIGVKQQTLAKIESGGTAMPRCLPKLAKQLEVSIEWLITGKLEYAPDWYNGSLDKNTHLSVTVPIESPPITTTFDVPTNIKLEICKNMTPSTIELAYNTKSNNLVTAIYRLMNIGKEQDRLKVLLEIDDLIQAEIDMEKYVLEPATPKPKLPA